MCDYHSFRPAPESEPEPQFGEEINRKKQKKEQAMRKHGISTGSDLQEDSFR